MIYNVSMGTVSSPTYWLQGPQINETLREKIEAPSASAAMMRASDRHPHLQVIGVTCDAPAEPFADFDDRQDIAYDDEFSEAD